VEGGRYGNEKECRKNVTEFLKVLLEKRKKKKNMTSWAQIHRQLLELLSNFSLRFLPLPAGRTHCYSIPRCAETNKADETVKIL